MNHSDRSITLVGSIPVGAAIHDHLDLVSNFGLDIRGIRQRSYPLPASVSVGLMMGSPRATSIAADDGVVGHAQADGALRFGILAGAWAPLVSRAG